MLYMSLYQRTQGLGPSAADSEGKNITNLCQHSLCGTGFEVRAERVHTAHSGPTDRKSWEEMSENSSARLPTRGKLEVKLLVAGKEGHVAPIKRFPDSKGCLNFSLLFCGGVTGAFRETRSPYKHPNQASFYEGSTTSTLTLGIVFAVTLKVCTISMGDPVITDQLHPFTT
jgi:hypothetical protein